MLVRCLRAIWVTVQPLAAFRGFPAAHATAGGGFQFDVGETAFRQAVHRADGFQHAPHQFGAFIQAIHPVHRFFLPPAGLGSFAGAPDWIKPARCPAHLTGGCVVRWRNALISVNSRQALRKQPYSRSKN